MISCNNITELVGETLWHLLCSSTLKIRAGVSIKFEVGSWLEKYECMNKLTYGGLGACSTRKF